MNSEIFKSYDIRGKYPEELTEKDAYAIGRAMALYIKGKNIAIGRDARPSSKPLFEAISKGISDAGVNVLDLGLASTPMVYYASGESGVDGSICVTASHNPPPYNGFKLTKPNAVPIGGDSGLSEIKETALHTQPKVGLIHGNIIPIRDLPVRYVEWLAGFWQLGDKKWSIVIDCANAMGVIELPAFKKVPENITVTTLYDDLSHPFEAHEANPLKTETLAELSKKVIEVKADLGISYDGDADRIGFIDENGTPVPMDLMTAILSAPVLKKYPKSTILYDLRSSLSVKEEIEKNGGTAHECKVGHANIKKQMREEESYFAGELSGHYYFKENSYAEASTLAAIFLLNHMSITGKKLSELVAEVKKYFHTGEINNTVPEAKTVIEKLKEKYKDGVLSELDGIKISYPDWWFSVRSSNTEPLLRLNLEAKTKELMEQKKEEVLLIIKS